MNMNIIETEICLLERTILMVGLNAKIQAQMCSDPSEAYLEAD